MGPLMRQLWFPRNCLRVDYTLIGFDFFGSKQKVSKVVFLLLKMPQKAWPGSNSYASDFAIVGANSFFEVLFYSQASIDTQSRLSFKDMTETWAQSALRCVCTDPPPSPPLSPSPHHHHHTHTSKAINRHKTSLKKCSFAQSQEHFS